MIHIKAFSIAILLTSNILFAKEAEIKKSAEKRKPNQQESMGVIPLDASTQEALKASQFANQVKQLDGNQQKFHEHTMIAIQKVLPYLKGTSFDKEYFVYDCLFMVEDGFYLKYSKVAKTQLAAARKIVRDHFGQ